MSELQQTGAEDAEGELSVYERHRAIVRETDKRFSSIHGFGGAIVLAASLTIFGFLIWMTALTSPIPWVVGATAFLICLFLLASFRARKRQQLRESIERYCEINEIDLAGLQNYYANDGIYPYFESLFVEREQA